MKLFQQFYANFLKEKSFYAKAFATVLVIFGARLWLINNYGSSVPYWDQWVSPLLGLFLPWLNCDLTLEHFFAFHNEHRIFFTRSLDLSLLMVNGQWDPLVEMVVNSGIYVFAIFVLIGIVKNLTGRVDNSVLLILIFLGTIPFAWENSLAGLHSCWYLLLLFTFVALWGLLCYDNFTWQWWLGAISGLSAFFNIASGLLVLPVIIIIKLYLLMIDKGNRLKHLPTLVISILIASFCVALLPQKLHQTQLNEFVLSFSRTLAWPWINGLSAWLGLLMYLPFLALLLKIVLRAQKPSRGELFVLGLGGWVIVQVAAMVSVRGSAPAPRYMDILACGIIANFLAFQFISQTEHSGWVKRSINGYAYLWLIVFGYGLYNLNLNTWPAIEYKRATSIEQLSNVRNFIATGDITTLKDKPFLYIPFPNYEHLVSCLTNPQLRNILPSSLTSPTLLPANQGGTGILSVMATGLLTSGQILFFLGLWLLCLTLQIPLWSMKFIRPPPK